MANELKEGAVVQLKSGGPNMTIGKFSNTKQQYVCNWFAGDELKGGFFSASVLKLVDEPKDD